MSLTIDFFKLIAHTWLFGRMLLVRMGYPLGMGVCAHCVDGRGGIFSMSICCLSCVDQVEVNIVILPYLKIWSCIIVFYLVNHKL